MENTIENKTENKTENCPFRGWSCPQVAKTRKGTCRVGYEACQSFMDREENYIILGEFEPRYRR